ncbi:MAG TPA: aminoacyl-tRNA hydrolase [Chthoniobacteraceae bacterium]|jgi:PTH1 family peptidyl-tRNA hydrolase|nr:aminoacyl-tRNA hydrolase [Chthoniobacteraceae bacterium]
METPTTSPTLRLVVGLGNPGREYHETRHNVGFMIIDRLAAAAGLPLRKDGKAELARTPEFLLCKPLSYMNVSGEVVGPLARYYKIEPAEMLVVLDDMALPLGKLRLRPGGSAGGHNGLKSIIQHLGTNEIPRLRIGIGGAAHGAAVDHVLGRFAPEEREELGVGLNLALDAIACVRRHGLQPAMNQFN